MKIVFQLFLISVLFLTEKTFANFKIKEVSGGVDILYENESGTAKHLKVSIDSIFKKNQILATGPNGICRLISSKNDLEIRIGSNTVLQWMGSGDLQIVEGSILISKSNENPLILNSISGEAKIIGECSFIADSTSNGGYKFICLSGKPTLHAGDDETQIRAGRLVLVLGETNALGNAYDIDLLLLLKSSLLINAFKEPPPTMRKIGLAVYSQQLRLKNKYNALIGDAPTDKNLQMWVLGSSQNKKAE
jgi:hypothetical protein